MKSNIYKCLVTGEEKYIAPSAVKKKLSKFGSEDDYRSHYISASAAKLLRQGMTVDEVRNSLGITGLPDVNPHVLARLNLIRKKKSTRADADAEKQHRIQYLASREFRRKKYEWEQRVQNMTFKEWVEENTGGPNRAWLTHGACTGTCIRPDIFLSHNNKACDGCPCYEFCLCRNRRLSHEKKRRR